MEISNLENKRKEIMNGKLIQMIIDSVIQNKKYQMELRLPSIQKD
jgi:hypothetical protein